MAFQPFGRHLHNQIVVPLLVVSACVALVATFVGFYRLSGIVDSWVEGSAYQAAVTTRADLEGIATLLAADARLVAEDGDIDRALTAGDGPEAGLRLGMLRPNLGVDHILVLDTDGTVVAKTGTIGLAVGDAIPGAARLRSGGAGATYATFLRLGGHDTISGVRTGSFRGKPYTIVVSRGLDWEFLKSSIDGPANAYAVSAGPEAVGARYVNRAVPGRPGHYMASDAYIELRRQVSAGNPTVSGSISRPGSAGTFSSGGEQYTVRTERVAFDAAPKVSGAPRRDADPTGAARYMTVVLSNEVAAEAGRTTVALIAFWSVLAVLVLTGLGTVIARNVSAPLNALAESAGRVAAGDFTSKVEIPGSNEVAELADAFNTMTDSLRERTETLTKKVLELATLYEMSRALGSTLDLEVLLGSVLDSAMRIFDVDSGYVMLRDKNSERLDLRAWRGLNTPQPDEGAIRSSMSDWVVRQGRPLIFNPPQDETAEKQVDSVTGALAALCVPLISSEGVIGAIAVGSRDRDFRFSSDDVRLLSTIANHVTIAIGNIELFSSLQEAYLATVRSLAAAVDAKDTYTRGHSDSVAHYANAIAKRLGLASGQCTALEMAAYLHDIGKIGVREEILLKPGKLDDDEMSQMRHHPLIGANILKPVAFPWPIAPVVRHHHEHFDGSGYPAGLKGEEIPLLARILTVADAYEAMTTDRPYRRGRTAEEAIEELHACTSTHFDGRVVDALVEALKEMDDDTGGWGTRGIDEVQPEEARAIFVAVVDGMFASYRRLGGPRLASNLEADINEWLTADAMPFTLTAGHLTAGWDEAGSPEMQLEAMRAVIERTAHAMSGTTGRSLVDHFYDEAVSGLSERMRHLAAELDLYSRE